MATFDDATSICGFSTKLFTLYTLPLIWAPSTMPYKLSRSGKKDAVIFALRGTEIDPKGNDLEPDILNDGFADLVFGIGTDSYNQITRLMNIYFNHDLVGQGFGVVKLWKKDNINGGVKMDKETKQMFELILTKLDNMEQKQVQSRM